jgi:hypothetical protein
MNGNLVQTINSGGARSVQLDVSKIPNGIYTLYIISKDQTTKKLVTIAR